MDSAVFLAGRLCKYLYAGVQYFITKQHQPSLAATKQSSKQFIEVQVGLIKSRLQAAARFAVYLADSILKRLARIQQIT